MSFKIAAIFAPCPFLASTSHRQNCPPVLWTPEDAPYFSLRKHDTREIFHPGFFINSSISFTHANLLPYSIATEQMLRCQAGLLGHHSQSVQTGRYILIPIEYSSQRPSKVMIFWVSYCRTQLPLIQCQWCVITCLRQSFLDKIKYKCKIRKVKVNKTINTGTILQWYQGDTMWYRGIPWNTTVNWKIPRDTKKYHRIPKYTEVLCGNPSVLCGSPSVHQENWTKC